MSVADKFCSNGLYFIISFFKFLTTDHADYGLPWSESLKHSQVPDLYYH